MDKNVQSDQYEKMQRRLADYRSVEHQRENMHGADDHWRRLRCDLFLRDAVEKLRFAQNKHAGDFAQECAPLKRKQARKAEQPGSVNFWHLLFPAGLPGMQVPYLMLQKGLLVPAGSSVPSSTLLFEISDAGDALRGLVGMDGATPALGVAAAPRTECVCHLMSARDHYGASLPVPEASGTPLPLSLVVSSTASASSVQMQDMVDRLVHLMSTLGTTAVDMHLKMEGFGLVRVHIMQKYGSLCIVIHSGNAAVMSSCVAAMPALMHRLVGKHKKIRIEIHPCEEERGQYS